LEKKWRGFKFIKNSSYLYYNSVSTTILPKVEEEDQVGFLWDSSSVFFLVFSFFFLGWLFGIVMVYFCFFFICLRFPSYVKTKSILEEEKNELILLFIFVMEFYVLLYALIYCLDLDYWFCFIYAISIIYFLISIIFMTINYIRFWVNAWQMKMWTVVAKRRRVWAKLLLSLFCSSFLLFPLACSS
jgi:hypothetical protein